MWAAYHQLRTSVTFISDWRAFLTDSIGQKAYPTFYQFVSRTVFNELTKICYLVAEEQSTESPERPLTYSEQNALRYVAGYIIRKLRYKLETSHNCNKDDMILLLFEFAGD